jgi:hypothetical protein
LAAVANVGIWVRGAFIEIANPWDAKNVIRAFVVALVVRTVGERE